MFTSGGMVSGGGVNGAIPEKGLGKWVPPRMFSIAARKPGGRGTTESRARSMADPAICSSRAIQGLCEKARPRYQTPASVPTAESSAPNPESQMAKRLSKERWRTRKPIAVPMPCPASVVARKMPMANSGWVLRSWVMARAALGAITAPTRRPASRPPSENATQLMPR